MNRGCFSVFRLLDEAIKYSIKLSKEWGKNCDRLAF